MDNFKSQTNLNDNNSQQFENFYKLNPSKSDLNNDIQEIDDDANDSYRKGRWDAQEKFLFVKGCLRYGNNWKKVQSFIQTRSAAQIRSHAQKFMIRLRKSYVGKDAYTGGEQYPEVPLKEDIQDLIDKEEFTDEETTLAEKYILWLFKNDSSIKDEKESEFGKINTANNSSKNNYNNNLNNNGNESGLIFTITKGSKERVNNKKNINEVNTNKSLDGKILCDKFDMSNLTDLEKFIHKCLDSKEPKDLAALLNYFNNDVRLQPEDPFFPSLFGNKLNISCLNNNFNNNYNNNFINGYKLDPFQLNNREFNKNGYMSQYINDQQQFNPYLNSILGLNQQIYNNQFLISNNFINSKPKCNE